MLHADLPLVLSPFFFSFDDLTPSSLENMESIRRKYSRIHHLPHPPSFLYLGSHTQPFLLLPWAVNAPDEPTCASDPIPSHFLRSMALATLSSPSSISLSPQSSCISLLICYYFSHLKKTKQNPFSGLTPFLVHSPSSPFPFIVKLLVFSVLVLSDVSPSIQSWIHSSQIFTSTASPKLLLSQNK